MATMVSKMEKGRDLILYVLTIPLGISDLATGLICLAIFVQSGFLNSMLNAVGVIDKPVNLLTFQTPDSSSWRFHWLKSGRDRDHAGHPRGRHRPESAFYGSS